VYKWYGFGVERSRLGLGYTAIWRGLELYECLPVIIIIIVLYTLGSKDPEDYEQKKLAVVFV